MRRLLPALALAVSLLPAAGGQDVVPGLGLSWPEGAALPRSLTPAEVAWLSTHPLAASDSVTPPPSGPVHCAAEYEPMEGLLMAWEGSSSWRLLLQQMTVSITSTANGIVTMVVDTASEQSSAASQLSAAGADMSRVRFIVTPTDSIWIRDYGPRMIYEGACRAIVDHTYNRPRPLDDVFPTAFSTSRNLAFYEHQLVHGGGNFHLDAVGRSRVTRLVNNENPGLTEAAIHDTWQAYQNVDTTFYNPFPTSIDATQHIDMWMQVIADDKVIISDWPSNSGSTQDAICDAAAASMAAEGYTVYRTPARSVSGVHYTYTNAVMVNDLVFIPGYTNATVQPHNAQALAVWTSALPGKTIIQLDCQAIVSAAGVLHCIVMHVPAPAGGATPTAYVVNLNGGEVLIPGSTAEVRFITDDDDSVVNVDVLLSLDGGANWSPLALGTAADGVHAFTVPSVCTGAARVRVVARDLQGNTGLDDSDADFAIAGSPGCVAANIPYGTGKPGLMGLPVLSSSTPPHVPSTWTATVSSGLPNASAYLVLALASGATPFDGATILVDLAAPSVFPLALSGAGTASLVVPIPDLAALYGVSVFMQVWTPGDPGATGLGYTATNGLEARLGL